MSNRKRINISVDPHTYEMLRQMKEDHGFKNLCEMVVALVNILLDRTAETKERKIDLPDDDGEYIDKMFDSFGHSQRQPDGNPPKRHNRRSYG